MKSGLMVSWAERCFSLAARRVVLWLILMAAGAAQAATYSLVVTKVGTNAGVSPGAGAGTVSSTPGSISCGAKCFDTFVYDPSNPTIVVLSASPATGSTFTGWKVLVGGSANNDDGCTTITSVCAVVMDKAKVVIATFDYPATPPVGLAVTIDNTPSLTPGSGTITSDPGPMYCGPSCYGSYPAGQVVTLTATPAAGSKLSGWNVGSVPGSNTNTVTGVAVNAANKTVTLTLTTAMPAGGPVSVAYTAPSSGNNTIQDANSNRAVSLAATSVSNITGATDITPPVFGMATVNGNQLVMSYLDASNLDAVNIPLSTAFVVQFGCVSTALNCVVTLNAATVVTAKFDIDSSAPKNLSVVKLGTGAGIVSSSPAGIYCGSSCNQTFPDSTTVTLTAAPNSGSTFTGWVVGAGGTGSECLNSSALSCVVKMDVAKSVTATFNLAVTSSKEILYLYKLGTGSGAVTSDPAGIDCPPTGCTTTSASFDKDTVVTLTATSGQGSTFTGWSGGGSAVAVSGVAVNSVAKTVTLILGSFVTQGQNVTVAYVDPTTGNDLNAIQDINGTDAASAPESSVTNLTGVLLNNINTPPNFVLATVSGNTLVMSYADAAFSLDATKTPVATAFTVKVGNENRIVSNVAVNGIAKTVTLTLTPVSPAIVAVNMGQSVSVAYTVPLTSAIQDTHGNIAASLPESVVSNLTGMPSGTLPPMFTLAKVDGNQLVLSYVGPADLDAVNLPPLTAFAVKIGDINSCIGTASTCQVKMTTARSVNATFDGVLPSFFTIHVNKLGAGDGAITSYPQDASTDPINCGTDCNGSFTLGTPVVFKATANLVSNFTGWTTGCTNTPSPSEDCYVLKTAADILKYGTSYGVVVTFTKTTGSVRTLLVTKQGTGTGTVTSTSAPADPQQNQITCGGNCSTNFATNVTATLTATPAAGSIFTGWRGDCTGSWEDCVVSMNTGRSAIATFDLSPLNSIYVKRAGTGSGVVTSQPAGLNCGATCNANFAGGSSLILTATANSGSFFAGWAGPCTGTSAACTVGTSLTQTVTATFALPTPGTPVMVSATPGPASAVIAFTLPAYGVLPILRYDVSCQATGQSTVTASGVASPITVHGLAGRTTYACSVTAVNSSGASSPSAALSITTPRNANIAPIMMLLLN